MDLIDVMETYFRGERQVGILLAAVGLVLLGFAAWVWRTETNSFGVGLYAPLAVLGVIALGFGPWFAMKTERQVAELVEAHRADPAATIASERARMEKVDANWPRLKLAWGGLAIVALVLLLVVKKEWASGLGLALLLAVTLIYFVDVFAERRAKPYSEALRALDDAR